MGLHGKQCLKMGKETVPHAQGVLGGCGIKSKGNILHPCGLGWTWPPYLQQPFSEIQVSEKVLLHLQPLGVRNEMKIQPRSLERYQSRFGQGGLSGSIGAFTIGLQVLNPEKCPDKAV